MKKFVASILSSFILFASLPAMSDPVGGTIYRSGTARTNQIVSYRFLARANELTVITVEGDGDGDIDCNLRDSNGVLIDVDEEKYDGCRLQVIPRWTGSFTINMVNVGNYYSNYTMVIQ